MADRVVILSADAWSVKDENTSQTNEGISCWYVNDYRDDEDGSYGLKPTKVALKDLDMFNSLKGKLPAIAEVEMGSRSGAKNVATVLFRKITLIKPSVDLFGQAKASA